MQWSQLIDPSGTPVPRPHQVSQGGRESEFPSRQVGPRFAGYASMGRAPVVHAVANQCAGFLAHLLHRAGHLSQPSLHGRVALPMHGGCDVYPICARAPHQETNSHAVDCPYGLLAIGMQGLPSNPNCSIICTSHRHQTVNTCPNSYN